MEKLFFINLLIFASIIPLFIIRRSFFRRNIFLGRLLGNAIFLGTYLFILLSIFLVINYFFHFSEPIGFLIISVSLAIIFIIGYRNFSRAKVIHRTIKTGYHQDKHMRIAFISDVHLSALTNKNKIEEALAQLKNEKPDILFIGGDLIDFSCKDIKADFSKTFTNLDLPLGVFAILGNHEYHGGIDDNIAYIESLGITILKDSTFCINGLNIIGRDDITNNRRKKLIFLLLRVNPDFPSIVIDHNPISIRESVINSITLQLSGHTHKGQFFPYNLIVKKMYENAHGYKKFKNTHTIVSAGFSSWLIPYRINSTGEINIIDFYY